MRGNILIIGPSKSGKLSLAKHLTGLLPFDLPPIEDNPSHNGLTHVYKIETKYYTHQGRLWIDEYSLSDQGMTLIQETQDEFNEKEGQSDKLVSLLNHASPQPESVTELAQQSVTNSETDFSVTLPRLPSWIEGFTSPSASEVRDVLGAIIFTFNPPSNMDETTDFEEWGRLVECLEEEEWNGAAIALMNNDTTRNSSYENNKERNTDTYRDLLFDQGIQLVTNYDQLMDFIKTDGAWVESIVNGQGSEEGENIENQHINESVTVPEDWNSVKGRPEGFEMDNVSDESETSLDIHDDDYTELFDNDDIDGDQNLFNKSLDAYNDHDISKENDSGDLDKKENPLDKEDDLEFFLKRLEIMKQEFKTGKLDKKKTWKMCNDMANEFLDL